MTRSVQTKTGGVSAAKASAAAKAARTTQEVPTLSTIITQLDETLTSLKTIELGGTGLASNTEETETLKAEMAKLNEQFLASLEEVTELKAQTAKLNDSLEAEQADNAQLDAQLKASLEEVTDLRAQTARLQDTLEAEQTEFAQFRAELASQASNAATTPEDLNALQAEIDDLKAQIAQMSATHAATDAESKNATKMMANAAAKLIGNAISASLNYSAKKPISEEELSDLAQRLKRAEVLDPTWYKGRYTDLGADVDPAWHFVRWGIFEKRAPCSFGKVISKMQRQTEES